MIAALPISPARPLFNATAPVCGERQSSLILAIFCLVNSRRQSQLKDSQLHKITIGSIQVMVKVKPTSMATPQSESGY
jgi:hypothetical protein